MPKHKKPSAKATASRKAYDKKQTAAQAKKVKNARDSNTAKQKAKGKAMAKRAGNKPPKKSGY